MSKLLLIVALFALFNCIEVSQNEHVYQLTDENFDEALKEFKLVIVKFYAPWCGHCKKMAPAYTEASKKLQAKKARVHIAEVDCTVHKKVCGAQDVKGYPTLKFFKNGKEEKYTGGRTEDSILQFAEGQESQDL